MFDFFIIQIDHTLKVNKLETINTFRHENKKSIVLYVHFNELIFRNTLPLQ